jgi:hypothetical protein
LQAAGMKFWTLRMIAEDLGITHDTVQTYHHRASHHRRCRTEGCRRYTNGGSACGGRGPRPAEIPPPDVYDGQRPLWSDDTYVAWREARVGRASRR